MGLRLVMLGVILCAGVPGTIYARQPQQTISPTDEWYEPNDTCTEARPIATDGIHQLHTLAADADVDWVSVAVEAKETYLIDVQVPPGSSAHPVVTLFSEGCAGEGKDDLDEVPGPESRFEYRSGLGGSVYIQIAGKAVDGAIYPAPYHLSVRHLDGTRPGAVIIAVGRYRYHDPVQSLYASSARAVFDAFQNIGLPEDEIYMLSHDMGDPNTDAPATKSNLAAAISYWPQNKVGPGRPLVLYFVGPGDRDFFYLDEPNGQRVTPGEADKWLAALESVYPDVPIYVVLEQGCAGSFIQHPSTLSRSGRTVMASTAADGLPHANQSQMLFSTYLSQALSERKSFYSSFLAATWATQIAYPEQSPWLDADGDGVPNREADYRIAATHGFEKSGAFCAGTSCIASPPPVIRQVSASYDVANGQGAITATLWSESSPHIKYVWAEIERAEAESSPVCTDVHGGGNLSIPLLPTGDNRWQATHRAFDSAGVYRIVVYATDEDGQLSRPREVTVTTGWRVFLPGVAR